MGEDLQPGQHIKDHNQLGGIQTKVSWGPPGPPPMLFKSGGNGSALVTMSKLVQTDEEEGCRKDLL